MPRSTRQVTKDARDTVVRIAAFWDQQLNLKTHAEGEWSPSVSLMREVTALAAEIRKAGKPKE